jgi:hypothetical protein
MVRGISNEAACNFPLYTLLTFCGELHGAPSPSDLIFEYDQMGPKMRTAHPSSRRLSPGSATHETNKRMAPSPLSHRRWSTIIPALVAGICNGIRPTGEWRHRLFRTISGYAHLKERSLQFLRIPYSLFYILIIFKQIHPRSLHLLPVLFPV